MHTPSRSERKGTELFAEAAERLHRERDLRYEIITGVTHDYIMASKRKASIFFDQAGRELPRDGGKLIGWYGNSALEAAVFGVPVVAHLSDVALERAETAGHRVQVINTDPTASGLYRVLGSFFDRDPSERHELASYTRSWIEGYHSYHSTAAKLSALYDQL